MAGHKRSSVFIVHTNSNGDVLHRCLVPEWSTTSKELACYLSHSLWELLPGDVISVEVER